MAAKQIMSIIDVSHVGACNPLEVYEEVASRYVKLAHTVGL